MFDKAYREFRNGDFENIKEGIKEFGQTLEEISVSLDSCYHFSQKSDDWKHII